MDSSKFIEEKEKNKMKIMKIQGEKNKYLGEYKERVMALLYKDQLEEDDVYPEIIELFDKEETYLLKMTREVDIKKLKPYIKEAEKKDLRYQLVDGIQYNGNVGLVVVSKKALEEEVDDPAIRDMDQDFIDAGLGEIFSKNRGNKICKKHYNMVEEKLPEYADDFKKLTLIDKVFGKKCPICEGEEK
ncbi:MAG: DUF1694 domain-containing protein [Fusobacteriota bacterium]